LGKLKTERLIPVAPRVCQLVNRLRYLRPWRRSRLGYGRLRPAPTQLRLIQTPTRVIVPLSVDEVARFRSSFPTSHDLAIVGLLLYGYPVRSCRSIARTYNSQTRRFRVRGKGNRVCVLPPAHESVELLDHYMSLERPARCGQALLCLKGPARGHRMTSYRLGELVGIIRSRQSGSTSGSRRSLSTGSNPAGALGANTMAKCNLRSGL